MKRYIGWIAAAALVLLTLACNLNAPVGDLDEAPNFAAVSKTIGINVVLNTAPTDAILAELALHGKVRGVVPAIEAVTMQVKSSKLATIRALPYVAAANPDQERKGAPVSTQVFTDFAGGMSTWNLDAINVTEFGTRDRQVPYDGSGVYVAIIDTGLVNDWQYYFPAERIATQYAACFGGGGGEVGNVSQQPNKWGQKHQFPRYARYQHHPRLSASVNNLQWRGSEGHRDPGEGPEPEWFGLVSVVARGITYVADLKDGPLKDHPVVINMSLGGPSTDWMEKGAIDYAISKGVIIIASAGQ